MFVECRVAEFCSCLDGRIDACMRRAGAHSQCSLVLGRGSALCAEFQSSRCKRCLSLLGRWYSAVLGQGGQAPLASLALLSAHKAPSPPPSPWRCASVPALRMRASLRPSRHEQKSATRYPISCCGALLQHEGDPATQPARLGCGAALGLGSDWFQHQALGRRHIFRVVCSACQIQSTPANVLVMCSAISGCFAMYGCFLGCVAAPRPPPTSQQRQSLRRLSTM